LNALDNPVRRHRSAQLCSAHLEQFTVANVVSNYLSVVNN